jgi:hypothetical protein
MPLRDPRAYFRLGIFRSIGPATIDRADAREDRFPQTSLALGFVAIRMAAPLQPL